MHRNDRNEPRRVQDGGRDRSPDGRRGSDDRESREREDQQRWATDRDNFGGGDSDHDHRRPDDVSSGGWSRDGYGFRGPSFREAPRDERELRARHDSGWQAPGAEHRDHYEASGGYFDDQRSGPERQPERTVGYGRAPAGGHSEYGRGRDGGMPGRGDGRERSAAPRDDTSRTSGRGKGPKNFTRSDERILEDVCHALEDCHVDASHIEVRVTNGEVTLEGHVADRRDKREAEDVCADTRGVKQVHNLLRIGEPSATSGNGAHASSSRPGDAGRS